MISFRISAVSTNVAIIPNTSLHNPVGIPLKFLHIFCAKRTGHCQAFLWDSCWILGILMPSFQNPSFCYGFASLASETEDFKSLHMFLICTFFWDVKIFMGFSSPSAETWWKSCCLSFRIPFEVLRGGPQTICQDCSNLNPGGIRSVENS